MGNRLPELAVAEHQGAVTGSKGAKRVLVFGTPDGINFYALNVDSDGNLGIKQAPGSITSDRKSVTSAGTAEKLVASSTPCQYVEVSADLGNTNPVVVGGSDVVAASDSQKGIVLIPGNDPWRIDIDDVSKLYVDAQTNGDSVTFNYYV